MGEEHTGLESIVSIPKEDARRTDIVACIPVFASMTTMRWSHSALRRDAPDSQSAMDFQDVSLNVCIAEVFLCTQF